MLVDFAMKLIESVFKFLDSVKKISTSSAGQFVGIEGVELGSADKVREP